MNTVKAIYENGVLRILQRVSLHNHQEVEVAIITESEGDSLSALAMQSPCLAFLKDPAEDIYTAQDGEPLNE